jgi:hypothetical protein
MFYSLSTLRSSSSYSGYVNTPILGPLSTNQYPSVLPYHKYGALRGIRPTPPQFYPGQEPLYADMNTNSRNVYKRTTSYKEDNIRKGKDKYIQQGIVDESLQKSGILNPSRPTASYIFSSARHLPVSTHTNYIASMDSSTYLERKKSIAIGKSSFKVGLPITNAISTQNVSASSTRTTIRRVRSGGCTAPKKKGAINT